MNEWREFLEDTVGRHLYEFWLDCEVYSDSVDQENDSLLRSRLFRCVPQIIYLDSGEMTRRNESRFLSDNRSTYQ